MPKVRRSVFISHANEDTALARDLAEEIGRRADVGVFLDDAEMRSGEQWDAEIRRAVEDSDVVIAVVTPNTATSNRNSWIAYEIGLAAGLGKPIVAVLIGVVESQVPLVLAGREAVKWSDLNRLVDIVRRPAESRRSAKRSGALSVKLAERVSES